MGCRSVALTDRHKFYFLGRRPVFIAQGEARFCADSLGKMHYQISNLLSTYKAL